MFLETDCLHEQVIAEVLSVNCTQSDKDKPARASKLISKHPSKMILYASMLSDEMQAIRFYIGLVSYYDSTYIFIYEEAKRYKLHNNYNHLCRWANHYQKKRTKFKRFINLSYFSKIYQHLWRFIKIF